jgi:glucose-6-phosphate dehydrogenase assembly protein OpcA
MISNEHSKLGLADLQWSRLRTWRETIAQFFTPYDRRAFLQGISEVGIDYAGQGRGNRIGAAFVTGWMASALGWKLQRATSGAGGVVVAHYTLGRRAVEVNFRSVPKEQLANGEVSAIRIEAKEARRAALHRLPSYGGERSARWVDRKDAYAVVSPVRYVDEPP